MKLTEQLRGSLFRSIANSAMLCSASLLPYADRTFGAQLQSEWKVDVSHATIPTTPATGMTGTTPYKVARAFLHEAIEMAKDRKDVTFFTLELTAKEGTPGIEVVMAVAPGTKLDGKAFWRSKGGSRPASTSPSVSFGSGSGAVRYPPFQAIWLHGPKDANFKLMSVFSRQEVDNYSIRIEFGKSSGGCIPGKIYFCGDPDKSWKAPKSLLAGNFQAKILPVGK